MNILITGGGGFLGTRLAQALWQQQSLKQASAIRQITLLDIAFPNQSDARCTYLTGDLTDKSTLLAALGAKTDVVFHLASVVSGAAEADIDLGMRVNIDGTRALLDACRTQTQTPQLIFTSSLAVFGGALPAVLDDTTLPKPQSSYGAQKVCCEYLISDYTRKGFIDGRVLRLPTIAVRPGKPNMAASSFASGIIREPLNGQRSVCPVGRDAKLWLLSPRHAIKALIHAAELDATAWGNERVLNIPGITTSVGEMVEALARIGGEQAVARIDWQPDKRIQDIVLSWPTGFDTTRAQRMGFVADNDFLDIVKEYVQDAGLPHRA